MLNENCDVQITPWKSSQDMVILRRKDEIGNIYNFADAKIVNLLRTLTLHMCLQLCMECRSFRCLLLGVNKL